MLDKKLHTWFLKLLGVRIQAPSLLFLKELIGAHFALVPFENISKIHYKTTFDQEHIPSYRQYLEGISGCNFGGTCYANNYYFYSLLEFLGFRVKLCAADIRSPGTHMVIQVILEQREYLLDVGYAAPFMRPIPLDSETDYCLTYGRDRFVFYPRDDKQHTRMQLFRDNKLLHGYTVRPGSRKLEDFSGVINASFRPDSTFFNTLLITKFSAGRFRILHNLEYIESDAIKSNIRRISSKKALPGLIEHKFNIPEGITSSLLESLHLDGNAWT